MNIPDKFGTETAWRTWKLGSDGLLRSVSYDAAWVPDEPLVASCKSTKTREKRWEATTTEDAVESGELLVSDWEPGNDEYSDAVPKPPRIALPVGLSYVYREPRTEPHTAPHVDCACGIYAASTAEGCRGYGKYVLGRVALWGNVVPGDHGFRAECAYPEELFLLDTPIENRANSMWAMFSLAPEEQKPDTEFAIEALEAYGVPVHQAKSMAQAVKKTRALARPEGRAA